MSAPTNRWKLGAFVVGSVLVAATAVVILGANALQTQTVSYTSYFDEAVTGLEVGSPVSYRGVKIGNVSGIDVAPDRRHVEISYELGTKVLGRLGLAGATKGMETRITVPDNLRVQLASTGLTGTKFLQLDFFEVENAPAPTLPFPVPHNYIPAMPSTMKSVEDAIIRGVELLPVIARDVGHIVAKIELLVDDVQKSQLPAKAALTLDTATRLLLSLQAKIELLKVDELSAETRLALKNVNLVLQRVSQTLERISGEGGLLSSVHRVSDSLGDVTGHGLDRNLSETLRELKDAATGVRKLVESLERDPDMLIKGKGEVRP